MADIKQLAEEAEQLPQGAAMVVAQVTMGSRAPPRVTPADVADGLRAMDPLALDSLRRDMSLMRAG